MNFHDGESPHPFSILNYDPNTNLIELSVKSLGDYTHKMVEELESGQVVSVEGGYGYFQTPLHSSQVWVGAGIGIVPFISRLNWLQSIENRAQQQVEKVDLFYCVNSEKEAFFAQEIQVLISNLNFIKLHLLDGSKGEFLDSQRLFNTVDIRDFDVSFCGPVPFKNQLKKELATQGVSNKRFHTELFNMR